MSNWNKIFKPIVVLVIICIVITGALAATNSVTAPIIDEATRVAQQKARTELLPEAEDFEPVTGVEVENVSDIYASTNDVGVIITSSAKGYGGDVVVMTAFNPDGTIKQIKVTEQAETKGIGSKVVARRAGRRVRRQVGVPPRRCRHPCAGCRERGVEEPRHAAGRQDLL